jgi:hypothetical protein
MAFLRATEAVSKINVPIDPACREYADANQILGGKASIAEDLTLNLPLSDAWHYSPHNRFG